MIVVGLGVRQNVTADEIEAIIQAALEEQKFTLGQLDLIAAIDRDDIAKAMSEAASKMMKPMTLISIARLKAEAKRCQTHSAASMKQVGVPSVAEAAALAALGEDGLLISPRIKHPTVTAALAIEIVTENPFEGLTG